MLTAVDQLPIINSIMIAVCRNYITKYYQTLTNYLVSPVPVQIGVCSNYITKYQQ